MHQTLSSNFNNFFLIYQNFFRFSIDLFFNKCYYIGYKGVFAVNMLDKIRLLMKEKNIKNLHQLAEASGIPYGTIDSLFRKDYKKAKLTTLNKLKQCLDCSLDYLIVDGLMDRHSPTAPSLLHSEEKEVVNDYRKLQPRQQQTIKNVIKAQLGLKTEKTIKTLKVFNQSACAGEGNIIDSEDYELIEFDTPPVTAEFCVKIQGDSMQPLIQDGQIVFVQPNINLQENDIGIFCYQGEIFCKQLKHKNGEVILTSLNKNYVDKTVYDINEFSVIGRVL